MVHNHYPILVPKSENNCIRIDLNSWFLKIALTSYGGNSFKMLQSLKENWFHPSSSLINTIQSKTFWLFTFYRFQTIKKLVFHFCIICLFLFLFSCSFTNSINTFSTTELYSIDAGLIQNGCKSKCIKTTVVVAGWPMGALDYSFSRKCIFVKIRKIKSTTNFAK